MSGTSYSKYELARSTTPFAFRSSVSGISPPGPSLFRSEPLMCEKSSWVVLTVWLLNA